MANYNLPYDANAMDTMPHPLSPFIGQGSMNPQYNSYQQGYAIQSGNLPYDYPNIQGVYPTANAEAMAFESASVVNDFHVPNQVPIPMSSHKDVEKILSANLPYDGPVYNQNQAYESQNISTVLSSSPKPLAPVKMPFSNLPYDAPSFTSSFDASKTSDAQLFQSKNLPYDEPSYGAMKSSDAQLFQSAILPYDGPSFSPNSKGSNSFADAQLFQKNNLPYDTFSPISEASQSADAQLFQSNLPFKTPELVDCNVSHPPEGFEVPLTHSGAVNTLLLSGIEAEQRQGVRGAAAQGCGRIGHGEDTVRRHGSTNTVPIHPSPAPQYAAAMATGSADVAQHTAHDQMDLQQLFSTLNEYLALEAKFQPRLCLPTDAEQGEVSTGARDGAAHIMRCLKVWFDLPADVLFHAINLLDRFLTKMKVRPCHVPCITVSCMNIALTGVEQSRTVTVDELVTISQSACTPRDVLRMSKVIEDKLSIAGSMQPVTALQWLRLFYSIVTSHTSVHCKEEELVNLIEIATCDYNCANTRASELALVLLYHKLEDQLMSMSLAGNSASACTLPDEAYRVYELFAHLQHMCHMSDASLMSTRTLVSRVLTRYERGSGRARQRLVWRLSERTLKVLRPTDRLTSLLPTIQEQQLNTVEASPPRNRSGSESSLNEETCDWPRSPVLPVYCES